MPSPQLQNAIDEVYAQFRVPKPHAVDGCPCCTTAKERCRLLENPLRELSANDLSRYAGSVFFTMGAERDFQYFLPRLFELETTDTYVIDPPILLRKLHLAHWEKWPDDRRKAVKGLIDAWFAEVLDAERLDGFAIDDLLCGIACADLPLDEYLATLSARPKDLADFVQLHAASINKGRGLLTAFWKGQPDAAQKVAAFVKSALSA